MAEDDQKDDERVEVEETEAAEVAESEAPAPVVPEEEVDLGPPPEPPEELPPIECPKCAGGGAPAWMATFADMATLLMAFFVLLLSFAAMNVPKSRTRTPSSAPLFSFDIVERLQYVMNPTLHR